MDNDIIISDFYCSVMPSSSLRSYSSDYFSGSSMKSDSIFSQFTAPPPPKPPSTLSIISPFGITLEIPRFKQLTPLS
ncbi:hypothetical protein Q1695_002823 [Nippostrongylus brasiliensis]|nr:hypothetical protein Q1695_002823 [Nippostrongylus brasiliensis]